MTPIYNIDTALRTYYESDEAQLLDTINKIELLVARKRSLIQRIREKQERKLVKRFLNIASDGRSNDAA